MKKNNASLVQLISFMINKYGDLGTLDKNTQLEEDLKITGDEAVEFLIEYGAYFNVDVSNFRAADYFHDEGSTFFSLFKRKDKKILIIGDLIAGIEAGRLDEEIIDAAKNNLK
uniref:DUF1493 family protein n=1 Tax=uncultured Dysgonomonas sp. TaxID=206096 RepID=UPI0026343F5A|nr:DUF1493 family protein [uncultured Dysgonomonas sp.]